MAKARHTQPQTHIITVPPLDCGREEEGSGKVNNVIKSIDFTMLAASALLSVSSTAFYLAAPPSMRVVPTRSAVVMQEDPNVRRFVDSMAEVSAPDTPADIKAAPDVKAAAAQIKKQKMGKKLESEPDLVDQITSGIAKAWVFATDAADKVKDISAEYDLQTKAKDLDESAREAAVKLTESAPEIMEQAKAAPSNFVENNFVLTARAVLEVLGDEVGKASKKAPKATTAKQAPTKAAAAKPRGRATRRGARPTAGKAPMKPKPASKPAAKGKTNPFDFFEKRF